MTTITRRNAFAAIAVLPATAGHAAARDDSGTDSPIMTLFRQWQAAWDRASDRTIPEPEGEQLVALLNDLEARMLALPSTSAADFAAKFIAHNGHGDYAIEADSPFRKEALALVGGRL